MLLKYYTLFSTQSCTIWQYQFYGDLSRLDISNQQAILSWKPTVEIYYCEQVWDLIFYKMH